MSSTILTNLNLNINVLLSCILTIKLLSCQWHKYMSALLFAWMHIIIWYLFIENLHHRYDVYSSVYFLCCSVCIDLFHLHPVCPTASIITKSRRQELYIECGWYYSTKYILLMYFFYFLLENRVYVQRTYCHHQFYLNAAIYNSTQEIGLKMC